jgi:hypothetical protein
MILMIKTDHIGDYYNSFPQGFKLAIIDDFHTQGKVNVGMIYLVLWNNEIRYSVRKVNDDLTGKKINPLIRVNKVFVNKD